MKTTMQIVVVMMLVKGMVLQCSFQNVGPARKDSLSALAHQDTFLVRHHDGQLVEHKVDLAIQSWFASRLENDFFYVVNNRLCRLRSSVPLSEVQILVSRIPRKNCWISEVSQINHQCWEQEVRQGRYLGGLIQQREGDWVPLTSERMAKPANNKQRVVLVFGGPEHMPDVERVYFEPIC